jgi:hypothetical protein
VRDKLVCHLALKGYKVEIGWVFLSVLALSHQIHWNGGWGVGEG